MSEPSEQTKRVSVPFEIGCGNCGHDIKERVDEKALAASRAADALERIATALETGVPVGEPETTK